MTARPLSEFGRLGFGAANAGNLYHAMSDEAAAELFAAVWDAGVRLFDTAPHYGLGLSEERIGAALRDRPRDEFFLSTKVGRLIVADPNVPAGIDEGFDVAGGRRRVADYTRDGVHRCVAQSLDRLGLDRVDGIWIHDPEHRGDEHTVDHLTTAIPACQELKDQGLVRWIGVGSCSVPALQAGVDHGGIDVVMLAGGFTLLTQPAHPALLDACARTGVQILATAPFNSGFLATHPPRRDGLFAYATVPPALFDRATTLAHVCEEYGVELPTAALQFPLQYPPCTAVVTAAATVAQARQTIARMAQPVPAELWARLREDGMIP